MSPSSPTMASSPGNISLTPGLLKKSLEASLKSLHTTSNLIRKNEVRLDSHESFTKERLLELEERLKILEEKINQRDYPPLKVQSDWEAHKKVEADGTPRPYQRDDSSGSQASTCPGKSPSPALSATSFTTNSKNTAFIHSLKQRVSPHQIVDWSTPNGLKDLDNHREDLDSASSSHASYSQSNVRSQVISPSLTNETDKISRSNSILVDIEEPQETADKIQVPDPVIASVNTYGTAASMQGKPSRADRSIQTDNVLLHALKPTLPARIIVTDESLRDRERNVRALEEDLSERSEALQAREDVLRTEASRLEALERRVLDQHESNESLSKLHADRGLELEQRLRAVQKREANMNLHEGVMAMKARGQSYWEREAAEFRRQQDLQAMKKELLMRAEDLNKAEKDWCIKRNLPFVPVVNI
ncbi:MAG: hypothetical protein CYPHOPRED_003242 [Cyphobasidiales sp. Tagirdzhanova-0007]|nr:MAG: hypothetical protein CYPHOPRED_003242 [Cyphobasidiales sp. Tagirdzhanova-0007]